MKITFVFSLLALSATQISLGATLECWKKGFTPETPYMTARILSNKRLQNVRFHYRNSNEENTPGPVIGKLITTNHSPYKGNDRFLLKNVELLLPSDLSSENLENTLKTGIGYYKGENGVLIGTLAEGEGGNHYSVRLVCSSDKE